MQPLEQILQDNQEFITKKEPLKELHQIGTPLSTKGTLEETTKKEPSSSFAQSFYASTPVEGLEDKMGKPRRNKKQQPSPNNRRRGIKSRKSISLIKRSFKFRPGLDNDDSIMILSPADSLSDISDTSLLNTTAMPTVSPKKGGGTGGGGHYKEGAQRPFKRIRLFNSPKSTPTSTVTSASSSGNNNTIDLVDDDEEEVIVLSDGEEDFSKDVSVGACNPPTTRLTEVKPDEDDTDDIEIVAVKVNCPGPTNRRRSILRNANNSFRASLCTNRRNSLSLCSVKLAVERVRKRINTPNINIYKTAVQSHGINKRKNCKKGKGQFGRRGGNQRQNFNPSHKQRRNMPERRQTVPVYVLGQELGPANPNFNQLNANLEPWKRNTRPPLPPFIPLIGQQNPFSLFAQPSLQQQSTLPVEPNFVSVPGGDESGRAPGSLRPIVIDGSNIAMGHKGNTIFSCRGIQIVVDFFKSKGHEVVAIVPQYRRKQSESTDTQILEKMEKEGVVKFTPSREVGLHRIASYDDRFIVQYAHLKGAIIISNDNFKDIYKEEEEWRNTIRFRILQFTWMDENCCIFPRDPLGRHGPSLEEFLRF